MQRYGWSIAIVVLIVTVPVVDSPGARSDFLAHENARLRAHFDEVLHVLRARDAVPVAAAHARQRNLSELERYARAGAFPRNRGESVSPTSIFIDAAGARCAMAHLIEASGHSDLAQRVARTANLARIHDLAGDRELLAWLDAEGLAVDEAAMIQPEYHPSPALGENQIPSEGFMNAAALAAATLGSAAVAANVSGGSSIRERKARGRFGVLAGSSLLSAGVIDWAQDGHLRWQGFTTLTIGGLATMLGLMKLISDPNKAKRPSLIPTRMSLAENAAASHLSFDVRAGASGEPQLVVGLRY